MTAPDYWEVGASGQAYSRDFVLDTVTLRYEKGIFDEAMLHVGRVRQGRDARRLGPPRHPEGDRMTTEGSDSLLSPSDVADLAGVGRSVVSNWRKRHEDFPSADRGVDGFRVAGAVASFFEDGLCWGHFTMCYYPSWAGRFSDSVSDHGRGRPEPFLGGV